MPKLSDILDETENAKTLIELIEKFIKYARKLFTKKEQKELIDSIFREILKGETGDLDAATAAMKRLNKLGNTTKEFQRAESLLSQAKKPVRRPAAKKAAAKKPAAKKAAAKKPTAKKAARKKPTAKKTVKKA